MAAVSPIMADVAHGIQTLIARLQKYEQANGELDLRRENLESEILSVSHRLELEKEKQADLRVELAGAMGAHNTTYTHVHDKAKKSGIIDIVEDKVAWAKCCIKAKVEIGHTEAWANHSQPSSEDHLHDRGENTPQTQGPVVNALPATFAGSI